MIVSLSCACGGKIHVEMRGRESDLEVKEDIMEIVLDWREDHYGCEAEEEALPLFLMSENRDN